VAAATVPPSETARTSSAGHITEPGTLHGQPLLWQLGISTFQWSPVATAALRRHSNLMPITVPNYNRKTDRHQFGTLIGITSES
jgi:hypothetical protein